MYWLVLAILAVSGVVQAQLTAQSSIAPELRECYMNSMLIDRNNLPPTTVSTLIDIIQQIEDNPNVNMDIRQLAVSILHTYRQDGIEYHQPDTAQTAASNVLPYAPTFHSFHRHRLLLTRLIPSNLQVLANDTISSVLKCALHNMLSITVDSRVRGNENQCSQLSQYRALRTVRQAIRDDVEIIDADLLKNTDTNGQMRRSNPKNDVEYTNFGGSQSARQLIGESQCPLLNGVIDTAWGAVSAGNVIAGIAAGAERQLVLVTELTKGSIPNYQNVQQTVNSLFPATLTGDLAEAVLIQGTERGSTSISVGAAGGWNSTQARRFYMLQSRTNIEMTDPEMRGDIDGFILGSAYAANSGSYGSYKLSQLLDMYYSKNGVLGPSMRACNRIELMQQSLDQNVLANEAYAFAAALDTNMPLRGTIVGGLDQLVTSAVTNFQTYAFKAPPSFSTLSSSPIALTTASNLYHTSCLMTDTTNRNFRLRTNLYIALDSTWQYLSIYPAISYLLDSIEVGKYGSSVTLLSAFDGSVLINKTFSPAQFHSSYNLARHQSFSALNGVNLGDSLSNIRVLMQNELEIEKAHGYSGGNSTVLLYLINTGTLQNTAEAYEAARLLNETVPDLRILFASPINHFDQVWNLVRDMHNDILTVSLSTDGLNVETGMASVLTRIQQVGRRIVNPNCGSDYAQQQSGTHQFEDFLEPGYVNYYAISANYFYEHVIDRKIRITRTAAGSGNLIICHSRVLPQPRRNSTTTTTAESDVVCTTLQSSGNVEILLDSACSAYGHINACPPFYISVESDATSTATTTFPTTCTDARLCRFPHNIRYQVATELLGCYSSASTFALSFLVFFTAFLLNIM